VWARGGIVRSGACVYEQSEYIRGMTDDPNRWQVITGDCRDHIGTIPRDAAIISDPPYGMSWDTDTTRFSGGQRKSGDGRADWGEVQNDAAPFDPSPWLGFPAVVLFGANHYAQRLPVGTTLVWVKRHAHLYGTFLSDAEVAWEKGGHGVYCFHHPFGPSTRAKESGTPRPAHPTQKPVQLMRWAIERQKLPEGTLIVDPYCGSGSTGVAAVAMGYRFLGFELEERYAAVARRRIAAAADQQALAL